MTFDRQTILSIEMSCVTFIPREYEATGTE